MTIPVTSITKPISALLTVWLLRVRTIDFLRINGCSQDTMNLIQEVRKSQDDWKLVLKELDEDTEKWESTR